MVTSSTLQVLMTLSGLAATAAVERPSGETLKHQQRRILNGINGLLKNKSAKLATGGNWEAVWLGLTVDRANLAYVAKNTAVASTYAVVLRGTVAGMPIDSAEDTNVSVMLPFSPSGGGNISQGAMEAFTEIMSATDVLTGTTLLTFLQSVITDGTAPMIYITGHSLGGALATTVGLFLATQSWPGATPVFQVFTYAAPTAGDQNFAAAFNTTFPPAANPDSISGNGYVGTWNQWDVVPNSWWNLVKTGDVTIVNGQELPILNHVSQFFPNIAADLTITEIVKNLAKSAQDFTYVQPALQLPLNIDYGTNLAPSGELNGYQNWMAEVAFQHANNTYLGLLFANPIPALTASQLTLSAPNSGKVIITGTNTEGASVKFPFDSGVDFGVVPAECAVAEDLSSITATIPPGLETVYVSVTNMYGTSASAQFSYPS